MRAAIFLGLLFLSACVNVQDKQANSPSIDDVIGMCAETPHTVFYGRAKQYEPKIDGFYLDSPGLDAINLPNHNDKQLLGKIVVVTGKVKPMYPPGSMPKRNKRSVLIDARIIKTLRNDQELNDIHERCSKVRK